MLNSESLLMGSQLYCYMQSYHLPYETFSSLDNSNDFTHTAK